jgi:ribosomal protein S6--L-glutamate ligase
MKRRAATNEWRSYPHGGLRFAHKPSREDKEPAEAVGVEIAGVVLMSVENRPYVIEANASPGFRGLLEVTGTNADETIAEYAVMRAKR